MAIRTKHHTADSTWFITFTCFKWLPLFEVTRSYDMVYKWFDLINKKYQIKTLAFVIMPNHVHVILRLPDDTVNLNTLIANAKRFMAYDLVDRLMQQEDHDILKVLSEAVSAKEQAKGQLHKAFQPSFDAKPIYSDKFLTQKLDYIHHNPVSGKWSLAVEFTDYEHSSAAFYHLERVHQFVDITHYRDHWG